MNKFIKGCLYVTGILAAVGLVLFTIGAVFGGFRQAINIGRNGGFTYHFNAPYSWHVSLDSMDDYELGDIDDEDLIDYEEDDLGTADDIHSIEINLKAGVLNIEESEDDTYRMSADNVYKVKCYMEDHVLYIRGVGIKNDYKGIKRQSITLYVPKDAKLQDVDIELGAGTGRISSLVADKLYMEVGAGELKGDHITADSMDIQVGAGRVDMKNCVAGDIDYEIGMGSACYQGRLDGDAEVSCNMGSAELKIEGREEDYDYRIKCALGAVNVGSRQFTGISDEKRLDNSTGNVISLDCAMGNITVKFDE